MQCANELSVEDTQGMHEQMVAEVDRRLQSEGYVVPGDRVVVVAGAPVGHSGTTNLIQVHTIGDDSDHVPAEG